ncbi:MAG: hypothetical protein GQ569_14880 [Methylococcaceae bacterium]|nr:hypothetical protein [Methylococcaceae bacterium]
MKLLKNIALGLFIAASSVGITSVAHAETDAGRITFEPAVAIDNVVTQIQVALDAIAAGTDNMEVAAMIKHARDLNKEINANDKVDIGRQRANSELSKARGLAKKGKLDDAKQQLEEASKKYTALKAHL